MNSSSSTFAQTAKILRVFTLALMAFALVGLLLPFWSSTSLELFSTNIRFDQLESNTLWLASLLWNAGTLVWFVGLYQMQKLFSLHAQGEVFTQATTRCMTVFGACLALEPIVENVAMLGLEAYVGGLEALQSNFHLYMEGWLFVLEDVFIGLFVLFMATLLEQGRKLSQEIELTI